jgi:hypothetical protein
MMTVLYDALSCMFSVLTGAYMTDMPMSPECQPEDIPWTEEALARVEKAPPFVRLGIRKLVPQRAKALGQPIITSEFLTQIRHEAMLRVAKSLKHFGFEDLTSAAFAVAKQKMQRHPQKLEVLDQIEAFLAQRTGKNAEVIEKFRQYLASVPTSGLPWTPEALERLERLPEFVRSMVKQAVEEHVKRRKEKVVTPQLCSRVLNDMLSGTDQPARHISERHVATDPTAAHGSQEARTMPWDPVPLQRLRRIPIAAIRQRVQQRIESYCREYGADRVTAAHFSQACWRLMD